MAADARNTIPTAIIVRLILDAKEEGRLDSPTTSRPDKINISYDDQCKEAEKPGIIIDGQHRLLGLKDFSQETYVNVIALLRATDAETAFQFLVVNNKSSRVSPDHLKSLALEHKEADLQQRLKSARLSVGQQIDLVEVLGKEPTSPFVGLLDWPLNREGNRRIAPAALEASLGYIQDKLPEIFQDPDVLLDFFCAVWQTVKDKWAQIWTDSDSKLLDKAGIIAMSRYLTDALVSQYDHTDLDLRSEDVVREEVERLLSRLDPSFWTLAWKSTGYDTHAGRDLLVESLTQMSRNSRFGVSTYQGIKMMEANDAGAGKALVKEKKPKEKRRNAKRGKKR